MNWFKKLYRRIFGTTVEVKAGPNGAFSMSVHYVNEKLTPFTTCAGLWILHLSKHGTYIKVTNSDRKMLNAPTMILESRGADPDYMFGPNIRYDITSYNDIHRQVSKSEGSLLLCEIKLLEYFGHIPKVLFVYTHN